MAATPAPPLLAPPPAGEAGAAGAGPSLGPEPSLGPAAVAAAGRDPRVRCCSRRGLSEVLALCAPFLRALAEGQPGGPAAAGDVLWNFETAVRENVTINGQPWEETSEDSELHGVLRSPDSAQLDQERVLKIHSLPLDENIAWLASCAQDISSNIKILEDQFDELIVETATKRKQWPKKILMHAIQTMKAEQEMLKLYQPSVTPEELRSQLSQDAYIADLKQIAEMASKQISGAMKSLPVLIERAEGFSQALTWQPTLELCKLRQEVFAGCKAKEENNIQNLISPGEVTPTDANTSKNPCVLLKRKKAVDSPERRRYPLRRKITLST